jgi:hypothetical protein
MFVFHRDRISSSEPDRRLEHGDGGAAAPPRIALESSSEASQVMTKATNTSWMSICTRFYNFASAKNAGQQKIDPARSAGLAPARQNQFSEIIFGGLGRFEPVTAWFGSGAMAVSAARFSVAAERRLSWIVWKY